MSKYKSSDKYQITLFKWSDGNNSYTARLIGNIHIDKDAEWENFKEATTENVKNIIASFNVMRNQ